MPKVDEVLEQRGKRYGQFCDHAEITQALKRIMQTTDNWYGLSADKQEALEMIQHKVARILNGDPEYADNWIDIAGYSTLVAETLTK